ncbi:MAG TPA: hypothetical protein GX528_05145 [Firmicutes bacterium]|nr:hypothetical protein [Bacillota bacterium]
MKSHTCRSARLIFGLFLYALGIALTLQAEIGYAPWDVFHAGLSKALGITIGWASISTGVVVVSLAFFLGEKIGLGSLLNMVLVGAFLDLILAGNFLPPAPNFSAGVAMMAAGLGVISLATYFYISSAFGAGPRDSLMVVLARKTGLPVGICRAAVELAALTIGWRLGGMVGWGTVIFAVLSGFFVELTFRLLRFEVTKVQHEDLQATLAFLKPLGKQKSS